MKWIAVTFLFVSLQVSAMDLMEGLDRCARTDGSAREILDRAGEFTLMDFETRRSQVYVQLEKLRWHKTRCVQDTVMRYLPPDVQARELNDSPVMNQILINLALYRGVLRGERASARCSSETGRGCGRADVTADLQKQVLIAAVDAVISDLTHSLEGPGTLRETAFNRLAEIDRRIQIIEAQSR